MEIIASRSKFRLFLGLVGYLTVAPILPLLASLYGGVLGYTLGPALGMDWGQASTLGSWLGLVVFGSMMFFGMAWEVWARFFSEVRLSDDRLEFERCGKTISWPLDQLASLRVSSQSTAVHQVSLTEVSICLTGPDGRHLHLTDLNKEIADRLIDLVSDKMADQMARKLEFGHLKFGPSLRSHLNIASLGPPMLVVPALAPIGLVWLGLALAAMYFTYLFWKSRPQRVTVTATGLLTRKFGQEIAWDKIESVSFSHDRIEIVTEAGNMAIRGTENLLPLSVLVSRKIW